MWPWLPPRNDAVLPPHQGIGSLRRQAAPMPAGPVRRGATRRTAPLARCHAIEPGMRLRAFLLMVLLALLPAERAGAADPALRVEAAWSRATPGVASPGAAYATIVNAGSTADRLVAVSSPIATRAQLHVSVVEGSVATMR